jgi:hypothetical protein
MPEHHRSVTSTRAIAIVAFLVAACSAAQGEPTLIPPGPTTAASIATVEPSPVETAMLTAAPTTVPTPTPSPTPAEAESTGCPTTAPVRVASLLAADLDCFGASEITVIGWADAPPIFGVLPPAIHPMWLWWGVISVVVWDRPRGGLSDLACSQGECPPWMVLHLPPDSTVSLDHVSGWVVVGGHRDDPLAEKCHYSYPPGSTESPLPDSDARAVCRESFVVTSVKPTSPPPGS